MEDSEAEPMKTDENDDLCSTFVKDYFKKKDGNEPDDTLMSKIAKKMREVCEEKVLWDAKDLERIVELVLMRNKLKPKKEEDTFYEQISAAFVRHYAEESKKAATTKTLRVADITFKLDVKLQHSFDVSRFSRRVMDLFKWHTDPAETEKYMAPYFPLVQSSGMGKTKLFHEFRALCRTRREESVKKKGGKKKMYGDKPVCCQMILCHALDSSSLVTEFDVGLDVGEGKETDDTRKDIVSTLNGFLNKCDGEKHIVMFFDESQQLLQNNAFAFRCIRSWLREKGRNEKVVAVFAGTTARLANFYKDRESTVTSRNGQIGMYYQGGCILYPPFYDIFTIGIFSRERESRKKRRARGSDYERAIPFGRPLFALLSTSNKLENAVPGILSRMTLGEAAWKDSDKACLSILATRAQMGQTAFAVTSDLVSLGYANLSYYTAAGGEHLAQLCYFPDPVCARLAMCLMDKDWKIAEDTCFNGKEPTFWMQKARRIFSTGLCCPQKGDLGEVAAAFYLLFSGDLLRYKKNDKHETFSVNLRDWVNIMVSRMEENQLPGSSGESATVNTRAKAREKMPAKAKSHGKKVKWADASVSFIQVCRSYMRYSLIELSDQSFLESLYQAGYAMYSYLGCPAYDIVGSVRLDNEKYCPLLVSVKARAAFTKSQAGSACDAMKDALIQAQVETGFCILLLLGLDNPETEYGAHAMKKDVFTEETNNIVSRVIVVPGQDSFGVTSLVKETTLGVNEKSEIYASHGDLGMTTDVVDGMLRQSAKSATLNYLRDFGRTLKGTEEEPDLSILCLPNGEDTKTKKRRK